MAKKTNPHGLTKMDFNEWFECWPKAEAYNMASGSQGTGLRHAHSLMRQASDAYDRYFNSKRKSKLDLTDDPVY